MARGKQSTRKTKPNSEIVKSGNEDVDEEGLKNDLKSNDKEKLKKGKKNDKKEKGRIIASLHTYCKHMSENPNEKCSGLTAVHSTLDGAHVYTFSVSRNGQTLESEASSKLEAAISLLRKLFPDMDDIKDIYEYIEECDRQSRQIKRKEKLERRQDENLKKKSKTHHDIDEDILEL